MLLDRIVKRVGGRLRGALSGWIVPLERIGDTLRTELEYSDFPREFPDTTTGSQALDYIRHVWKRARSSHESLANEVRDVLPTAYAYCLEDCAEDASLSERWDVALPEAAAFAEREWVILTEADDIHFDDIEDRRFVPSHVRLRTATGGHLGHSRDQQLRTAEAIGLPLLSSSVILGWRGGEQTLVVADEWVSRFELICELLQRVRSNDRREDTRTENEPGTPPAFIHARKLAADVRVGNGVIKHVPVNARMHNGALTVAGRPLEFGADAAKELLREFSFWQRAGLAADLTGMLTAIGSERKDFRLAVEKFKRSHLPELESPTTPLPDLDNDGIAGSGDRPPRTAATSEETAGEGWSPNLSTEGVSFSGDSGSGESDLPGDAPAGKSKKSEQRGSGSTGGSYTKERALSQQNALTKQLKSSLKGEIAPKQESDSTGEVGTINGDSGADLGDEEYREVAAQYEREAGRNPELGDPRQTGWDIRSTDPKTRAVRLIEVKGKGCPWDKDEVVELSRAQIRKAFETTGKQAGASWYLYVVEKTDDGNYQVLPIASPVDVAAKWILEGKSWRMVAENPKHITIPPS